MSKDLIVKTKSRRTTSVTPLTPKLSTQSKRKQRSSRNQLRMPQPYLSDCARDYLQALTDPFGFSSNINPCVPDLLDIPSFKFNSVALGTFSAGPAGVGFIAISPINFTSDLSFAQSTNNTYAGSVINTSGATGVLDVNNTRFPFPSASPRDCRLVALGVRARYIGTELNRGGRIVCAVSTAQGDTLDGANVAQLLARSDTMSYPCDRKWHGVNWRPLSTSDTQYTSNSNIASAGTALQLAILVSGTQSSNTFEYQIIGYYEAIPRYDAGTATTLSVPGVSKSHSDIGGMSQIRDYLGSLQSSEQGSAVFQRGLHYIKNMALSSLSSYSPALGGFARALTN